MLFVNEFPQRTNLLLCDWTTDCHWQFRVNSPKPHQFPIAPSAPAWYSNAVNRKTSLTATGLAQLTLVEHSLCPLDRSVSLQPGLTHQTRFSYSSGGQRQVGNATLHLPLGFSTSDEFYLWGLLALTLRQPDGEAHLAATPHYCLRQLGVINTQSRRGGKNYEQFRESLKRLAAASYQCDRFYDPLRQEHCQVAFGFLSYRLPLDSAASRLWHFYWDPVFFELCAAQGGRLAFDLALYRRLDPASRRLFLLLHKVFHRRQTSPVFPVRRLCEDVLGFSPTLTNGELNRKLQQLITRLQRHGIIASHDQDSVIRPDRNKSFSVQFQRGRYFQQRHQAAARLAMADSSLTDALTSLGFDMHDAGRIQTRYAASLLKEWIDITLAAIPLQKIKRSPQAFLVDNLKAAAQGTRTAPDWWLTIRKQEQRTESKQQWESLRQRVFQQQPAASSASRNASQPQRISELLNL